MTTDSPPRKKRKLADEDDEYIPSDQDKGSDYVPSDNEEKIIPFKFCTLSPFYYNESWLELGTSCDN